MKGRVLSVAGSDSGGGAGIQADIKTITALNGYALTALTALTAQDTQNVHATLPVPPDFVALQIRFALGDPGVDAIKTGMLTNAATVQVVLDEIKNSARLMTARLPLVVDPVMIAKGGESLLDPEAVALVREGLVPAASVLTPNLPEASALTGLSVIDEASMKQAGQFLLEKGARAVLLKGGHLQGPKVVDLLMTQDSVKRYEAPRIETRHTHGTGCTLASAIATGLAQDMTLEDAVTRAISYVRAAMIRAPGFGGGHGPLNHAITVNRLTRWD
ncbi:bifunctional hydroxymethylpyrimidine kinase/phosphomethylpyrimidine kinase [Granulibacter bethesdensis]|uniref:bifunctional hydroxymethylpyrimidine kinase/phosphomethylpyrimidine kinase n=1 Tax=Granulibacter bethesdensis TaxID=364410 RepID=UPI0003F1D1CF|nr:bifunctional hydroxymethylpyrimidine kinase/phosphomethylpyrimidine kinase [Granulibacter bethesdensis]AHJ66489.1 Phosphomethylpyrimidine kinase [Granulibacter bethesdensis CGDNIH4]APH59463.1 Phosphomethylpyrimidine kinase [Granulibacter bethesdensis]